MTSSLGSFARILRRVSRPFMPPMRTSISTRSGLNFGMTFSPSSPLAAVASSMSGESKIRWSEYRTSSSSSINNSLLIFRRQNNGFPPDGQGILRPVTHKPRGRIAGWPGNCWCNSNGWRSACSSPAAAKSANWLKIAARPFGSETPFTPMRNWLVPSLAMSSTGGWRTESDLHPLRRVKIARVDAVGNFPVNRVSARRNIRGRRERGSA